MQNAARALELLYRLNEVASVGPQSGMVSRDHDITRLAREPGKPAHLFPALGRILALVRVTAPYYHRVPPAPAHERAQRLDSFCVKVIHLR